MLAGPPDQQNLGRLAVELFEELVELGHGRLWKRRKPKLAGGVQLDDRVQDRLASGLPFQKGNAMVVPYRCGFVVGLLQEFSNPTRPFCLDVVEYHGDVFEPFEKKVFEHLQEGKRGVWRHRGPVC